MLKLEAVLVATTTARPWSSGWSLDQGIDFIVWAPRRPVVTVAPAEPGVTVAGEPVSFLDADDVVPAGTAIVTRYVSLAAAQAEAAAPEPADLPLTRAWSSMARKVAGS